MEQKHYLVIIGHMVSVETGFVCYVKRRTFFQFKIRVQAELGQISYVSN